MIGSGSDADPGHEEAADDEEFVLTMAFVAEDCPECGTPGEPGQCPHCGAAIPATTVVNAETQARIAALGPLLVRADALVDSFDQIPPGVVSVSLGQFATAITDADLFGRASTVVVLADLLGDVDLDDKRAVGGGLRRTIQLRLDAVEELLALCKEVGIFAPEEPADEARDLAVAAGRYGASVVAALVRLFTSHDIVQARANEDAINELLEGFPPAGRMSELLGEVSYLAALDDLDERVARVLKRDGKYTDDLGMLSLPLVFGAFSDHADPFTLLAQRGLEFFSYLLPGEVEQPASGVLLAVPAVTVSALDRPLIAHRCARLMTELCADAHALDSRRVQAVIEHAGEQGAVIFAAALRIDRAARLLAVGEQRGVVDDLAALDSMLKTYLELCEASFRTIGWLALQLQQVVEGVASSMPGWPPTLGEIEQQLAASASPLCQQLAEATDSALRNAVAHAQYTWDEQAQEAADLRTGQRWAIDVLVEAVGRLVGTLAGTDAGYACFVVGHAVDTPLPAWASGVGESFVTRVLADAAFGAYGFEVVAVSSDGGEIELAVADQMDLLRLLPALAGLAAVRHETPFFRITTRSRTLPIVEVAAESLRNARNAPAEVQDLAILHVLADVALRARPDSDGVAHDAIALMAKIVSVTAMQQLATEAHTRSGFARIARRMSFAQQFVRERSHGGDRLARAATKRIQRARAAAAGAQMGRPGALHQVIAALNSLFAWSEQRGARWPLL